HIVPFDHHNPSAGGWSIASNLHPVCTCHHQAKTTKTWHTVMHLNGVIIWTSNTGHVHITVPDFALPATVTPRRRPGPAQEFDPTAKTWWENNMTAHRTPPTAAEERAADTDIARNRIRRIRRKFRQHKAIQRLRQRYADDLQPPPF
ncbi:HNH endonuclease, partial [Rhodococcus sp. G-MC3]|nr:HNH endonuclease [Rhodococcus sp. G-MC3]